MKIGDKNMKVWRLFKMFGDTNIMFWRQIYECLENLYCLETQILCSRDRNMKVWRLFQKLETIIWMIEDFYEGWR